MHADAGFALRPYPRLAVEIGGAASGARAIGAVAQDNPAHRQAIVNVIGACLRMPARRVRRPGRLWHRCPVGRKLPDRPGRWHDRRQKIPAVGERMFAKRGGLAVFFISAIADGLTGS